MGRRSESTDFLKTCLMEALVSLMEEKPFNKITINEIAQKAGVSRATYFRHFQAKEEILIHYFYNNWKQWASHQDIKQLHTFNINNTKNFFEFNFTQKEFLKLLYKNDLQNILLDTFFYTFNQEEPNHQMTYDIAFYTYGLYGVLDQLIKMDFDTSIEDLLKSAERISEAFQAAKNPA